jgi:hypothetical protein
MTSSPWYLTVLREEFSAKEGSFLLFLRGEMIWNREAFTRLTQAMLAYCKGMENEDFVPRWVAEGFWYMSFYVRGFTLHPRWKKIILQDEEYYERAYKRLDDLASWFFEGRCPSANPEKTFASM